MVTPLLSGVLEANGRFAKASRVLYLQSLSTLVLLASMMLLHALTPFRAASAYIVPSLGVFFLLALAGGQRAAAGLQSLRAIREAAAATSA